MNNALLAGGNVKIGYSKLRAVLAQFFDHLICQRVRKRFRASISGNNVIDCRKCPAGIRNGQPQFPEHGKCLGTRDLVDEVSADEQLGLPVRQFANRVRRPYFLKECFSHLTVTEQPFALEGKVLRKDSTDHKVRRPGFRCRTFKSGLRFGLPVRARLQILPASYYVYAMW
jgi:hypothetical protein